MKRERPDVQAGFRKGRGTRDQIANILWIIGKSKRIPEKHLLHDYTKTFVWITTNWGKFLKRWEYQTILPASWEICMQVKKQQLELDMEQQTGSKLGKEYIKAVYCHPVYFTYMQNAAAAKSLQLCPTLCDPMDCSLPGSSIHGIFQATVLEWGAIVFSLYAEYIMQNARLDESIEGIKIAGRNINNLRYADNTTLMAECEKELKNLLMKVKEKSEKAGLKLNIQQTKIMASVPITSW